MPRGKIVNTILEVLENGAALTANLFDVFTSDYFTSRQKMQQLAQYGYIPSKNRDFKTDSKQKYYTILNYLKNQGFIEKKKTNNKNNSLWKITKKGFAKLKTIKEQNTFSKNISYKKESDSKIKVIIFDIPEKERYKRDWLRTALVSLNFSFLQQSVWIGKTKIPEEFIADLNTKKMLSCVHIFEISKKGTINSIS